MATKTSEYHMVINTFCVTLLKFSISTAEMMNQQHIQNNKVNRTSQQKKKEKATESLQIYKHN